MQIVDRRLNPKAKSLGNRQRFLRRAKAEIREAIKDSLKSRKVAEAEQNIESMKDELERVKSMLQQDPLTGLLNRRGIDEAFRQEASRCERHASRLCAAIVDLAGNLPYDVQRLAHETWDDVRASGGRKVSLDHLHATLARLLAEQDTMFEAVWQRLTLAQRAVLRAVVLQGGRELLSADVRARHRLGAPSSIQTSLAAMMKQDLLQKEGSRYIVVDSLLREWIARKTY